MTGESPDGIPPCSHRPPCPGCPRYGDSSVAPAALAELESLAREAGVTLESPILGAPIGHRHRARLMVRGRAGSPKIGLFQQGSHRIVDTPACHVHHPQINAAAAALKRAIRSTHSHPYADAPHRGLVRALQCVVARESETVQAVIVTNSADSKPAEALLEAFRHEFENSLHSLWWNGNPERTNTILGTAWQCIVGPPSVVEEIGGASIHYPPGAFGQSHLALADRLVEEIHNSVPPLARVAEFHAGCGAVGLGLVARGQRVAFNEIGDSSLAGLAKGLEILAAPPQQAAIHAGAASENMDLIDSCDVAIVDPPRRGLEPALVERFATAPPARLIYVACGLDSFVRDSRALLTGGALRLTRLVPFGLFPFTEHVESLAVFDRRSTESAAP